MVPTCRLAAVQIRGRCTGVRVQFCREFSVEPRIEFQRKADVLMKLRLCKDAYCKLLSSVLRGAVGKPRFLLRADGWVDG